MPTNTQKTTVVNAIGNAMDKGYVAHVLHLRQDTNPHHEGTPEHDAWDCGWEGRDAERPMSSH